MFTTRTKTTISWVIVFVLSLGAYYMITSAIKPPQTINEAVKAGLIKVDINSNDERSYSKVYLTVRNLSSTQQRILIPAGTLYEPDEDDEQELIQLNDEILVVNGRSENSIEINTFCTEASDRSPDGTFSLKANKNEKLQKLISYMGENPGSKDGLQDAVWAISDNHSVNNIPGGNEQQDALREFVATLTGQENSWYSSPQQYNVDRYGNINRETVHVTGELAFTADRAMSVHEEIQNGDGETMIKSDRHFQLRGGNVRYTFSIRVKGWEKGTYFVKVINDRNEQMVVKEFEV